MVYAVADLRRRLVVTTVEAIGLAVVLAMSLLIRTTGTAVIAATEMVTHPLGGLGTGLVITAAPDTKAGDPDSRDQSLALNLADLGPAGSPFSVDLLQPSGRAYLPQNAELVIAGLPGVARLREGLDVRLLHSEGFVPNLVIEFHIPSEVIHLPDPTAGEKAAIDTCMAALPSSQQTATGFFNCLPTRLKIVTTQRHVIEQAVQLPATDIHQENQVVGGVPPGAAAFGLLTASHLLQGRFPMFGEAVVSSTYADSHHAGIGAEATVLGRHLKVVGISRPPLGGFGCDVYMSLAELQTALNVPLATVLFVEAKDARSVSGVADRIKSALPGIQVSSANTLTSQLTGSLVAARSAALSLTGALAMLATGLAIGHSALLAHLRVRRRIRDLGVLHALGWDRRAVVAWVATQASLLLAMAAVMSFLIAVTAVAAMTRVGVKLVAHDITSGTAAAVMLQPAVTWADTTSALATAAAALMVACCLAALATTRVDPLRAIRAQD